MLRTREIYFHMRNALHARLHLAMPEEFDASVRAIFRQGLDKMLIIPRTKETIEKHLFFSPIEMSKRWELEEYQDWRRPRGVIPVKVMISRSRYKDISILAAKINLPKRVGMVASCLIERFAYDNLVVCETTGRDPLQQLKHRLTGLIRLYRA